MLLFWQFPMIVASLAWFTGSNSVKISKIYTRINKRDKAYDTPFASGAELLCLSMIFM